MQADAAQFPGVPDSVPDRFGGIARLYGHAALERFLTARVAVIGVGGVGSWAVESLARSGIGRRALVGAAGRGSATIYV